MYRTPNDMAIAATAYFIIRYSGFDIHNPRTPAEQSRTTILIDSYARKRLYILFERWDFVFNNIPQYFEFQYVISVR